MSTTPTARQRLASLLLDADLGDWVAARRNPSDLRRSWRLIATELRYATNGEVDVTPETLRSWYKALDDETLEASA